MNAEMGKKYKTLIANMQDLEYCLMTARVWCEVFGEKFDESETISIWNAFHHSQCFPKTSRLALQVKDERGNWLYVKEISTGKNPSVWTGVHSENSDYTVPEREPNVDSKYTYWKTLNERLLRLFDAGWTARIVRI